MIGCRTVDKVASIHRHFAEQPVAPIEESKPLPTLVGQPENQEGTRQTIIMIERFPSVPM